jgi:excisionase family DNA binding protein
MNDEQTDFLTIAEVAKSLRISEATALRWLKAEKIAGFFRVGRQWRIRKKDFNELIDYEVARQSQK